MASRSSKPTLGGGLRVNVWTLLGDRVERGIAYGYHRAHKHDLSPDEAMITEAIYDAVMNELAEAFLFEGDHE